MTNEYVIGEARKKEERSGFGFLFAWVFYDFVGEGRLQGWKTDMKGLGNE